MACVMRDAGLRRIFQQHLPEFHWQAIETWSTGQGVPDANYCHGGKEGWVEFKRAKGWRVHFEPEQIAWLERRARVGGRCFVAIRRSTAPQTFWLFPASTARWLNPLREAPAALVLATGSPAQWPWKTIKEALTA